MNGTSTIQSEASTTSAIRPRQPPVPTATAAPNAYAGNPTISNSGRTRNCRIPSDQSSKASENATAFARVMAPTPVSHARIGQHYRRLSRPPPPRKRVEVRSHSGLQTDVFYVVVRARRGSFLWGLGEVTTR